MVSSASAGTLTVATSIGTSRSLPNSPRICDRLRGPHGAGRRWPIMRALYEARGPAAALQARPFFPRGEGLEGLRAWTTRSPLLLRCHRERILGGGRAVDRRHRLVQQPQIDEQLAAMVVPVVQHDGAHERRSRHGENVPAPALETPGFAHALIVESAERALRPGHAV